MAFGETCTSRGSQDHPGYRTVNHNRFALPVSPLFMLGRAIDAWVQSSMLDSPQPMPRRRDGDGGSANDEECRRSLREVFDSQLIPRLVLSHRPKTRQDDAPASVRPQDHDVEAFARACSAGDRAGTARIIERLRADGMDQDTALVDLIAPAAQFLGRQWEDDRLDFTQVTVGLVLMHEAIHLMGYEYRDGPQEAGRVRRIMLASAPGSQHGLGLAIVSEFYRKAGWQVVVELSADSASLCRAVHNEWFDVLGLSVALDAQLQGLAPLVARLKSTSRNPVTPVLLGGPVFLQHDLDAATFNAQAICLDARECVPLAASLLPL